jgi:hypothetical protein
MKVSRLCIILIFLISCNEKKIDIHKRLVSTVFIQKLNKFNWGINIEKPENTKFSLLEVKKLKENSFDYEYDCLFIKTSFKDHHGSLFIATKIKHECRKQLHKKMTNFLNFKEISISLLENSLVLKTDKKTIKILLLNLDLSKSRFMKRYSSNIKTDFLSSGVHESPFILAPILTLDEEKLFKYQSNSRVSKITPFTISNKRCHSLDGKCRSKKEYACDSCPYGFIEVVGSLCERGGDKYCAPKSCGGIGEPACYRGQVHTSGPNKLACQNESIEGFCNYGLKTFCSAGVLFCR